MHRGLGIKATSVPSAHTKQMLDQRVKDPRGSARTPVTPWQGKKGACRQEDGYLGCGGAPLRQDTDSLSRLSEE